MSDPAATMAAMTDEALLARFNRGERGALGLLAERYEAPLLGLAKALTGREDLAMDAVQDAWVRVIRHGRGFDGRSTFKTWVYRIVINRCRDLRAKRIPDSRPNWGEAGATAADAAAGPPPGAGAAHAELNGRLRGTVESLTEGQRLVVVLCYHRGLTHEQVAEILGIPVGTVKSRLHAALASLRSKLDGLEP